MAVVIISATCLAACSPENDNVSMNETTRTRSDLQAAEDDRRGSTPAPIVESRTSVFTPIADAKCRTMESNIEEGGYVRQRCQGPSGYGFEIVESDLRQSMVIIPPGGTKPFDLPLSAVVANGAFNHLGQTLEWRGPSGKELETLTVRVNVSRADTAQPEISNLAIIRLSAPACIVAIVPPGVGQSGKARAIADARLPPCLKQ
jgi:hypothetical protein